MMYPVISGLQPEYGWEMAYGETADGLMYIGPHRNYPAPPVRARQLWRHVGRRLSRRTHPDACRWWRAGQGRRGVRLDAMTIAPVDLLAIGPHPDDIEIGIGGIVAKHAALGHRVGLCDLTAGEMGSNGTVEERLAEAEAARKVLGAAWRVNLRLPDRAIGTSPDHQRAVASLVRSVDAEGRGDSVLVRSPSRPRCGESSAHRSACSVPAFAAIRPMARRGSPSRSATTSSTTWPCPRSSWTSASTTRRNAARWPVTSRSSSRRSRTPSPRGLTSVRFRQLVESRDAQFGAVAGVAFAEGIVVKQPLVRPHLLHE